MYFCLVQVRYLEERQTFAPEQVTAMMLTKLKEIAEAYLKTKVVDCVISVHLAFLSTACQLVRYQNWLLV